MEVRLVFGEDIAVKQSIEDGVLTLRFVVAPDPTGLVEEEPEEEPEEVPTRRVNRTRNNWSDRRTERQRYTGIEVFTCVKTSTSGICLRLGREGDHAGEPVWLPWDVVRDRSRWMAGAVGIIEVAKKAAVERSMDQWSTQHRPFVLFPTEQGGIGYLTRGTVKSVEDIKKLPAHLRSKWATAISNAPFSQPRDLSVRLTHLRVAWQSQVLPDLQRKGIFTLEDLVNVYDSAEEFQSMQKGVGDITARGVLEEANARGANWAPTVEEAAARKLFAKTGQLPLPGLSTPETPGGL